MRSAEKEDDLSSGYLPTTLENMEMEESGDVAVPIDRQEDYWARFKGGSLTLWA